MFRELPRYASTRRTTLPWAVDIPSHWQVGRAKSIMRALDVRSAAGEEELLTVSSSRGVVPRASAQVNMFKAESYAGHKLCWPGDLVINSLWAWGRGLGVAQHHGIVSTAYGVYRQHGGVLNADYLHQLVRSEPFQWELQVRSQGVWKSRLQITDDRWLDAPLLVPAHEEQAAIVKYLAHAKARIDKAIVAKRRLNALLREQSDLRHDAIVLGIEPTSDRLASVNAWFGDVPSGWAVEPLRARYHQQLGKMLSGKVSSGDHMRPYLRNVDVQWNSINVDDLPEMNISPSEEDRYAARQGDVLVCEGGDVGRAAIWERETPIAFQKALHRLRVISPERDDPRFLVAALRVAKRSGAFSSGRVSTIQHLTGDQIRRHRFAWPPIEEQLAIAEAIADLQAASDATATKIEREITLLQEFRTRLVADVVTGQVDVRAIAASLPEAPEQDADLDSLLDDDLEDVLGEGEE